MSERIIRIGHSYAIVDRHGDVEMARYSLDQAKTVLDNRQRAAKRKRRPCITCRKPFDSEGTHNRMCDRCRQTAVPGDWLGMGA